MGEDKPQTYIDSSPEDVPLMDDMPPVDVDPDVLFRELEGQIARALRDAERDPSTPYVNKEGPVVLVGVDSEFWRQTGPDGALAAENTLLSVQFFVLGDQGQHERIYYVNDDRKDARPRLSQLLLRTIIEAMDAGSISEWPSRVVLGGQFLRLDLAAFSDLPDFKNQLDNVGGKVATINKDVDFTYSDNGADVSRRDVDLLRKGRSTQIIRDGIALIALKTRFVDIGRHAVEGTTLERIGAVLGLPKLELPDGFTKDRMDILLRDDPVSFKAYAMRDAEITVRFMQRLQTFARDQVGIGYLPTTVSALAVQMLKNLIKDGGNDFADIWGRTVRQESIWNSKKDRFHTTVVEEQKPCLYLQERLIIDCYHGGRNEAFYGGPTVIDQWNDYDLAGAYTTGLVDLRHIDYDAFFMTRDPNDFIGHVLGVALVDFEFPLDTRYPCLPVDLGSKGLYFPLTGRSYCTAPEIEVALNLGCSIRIVQGMVVPWRDGDDRIFEPFVAKVRELRSGFKARRTDPNVATMDEEYAKLIGNAAYGKLAQGLKDRNVFDTRSMRSEALPRSAITNALMAAHGTGLIRAVMAELLAGVPRHKDVVSVTTDGFLTNAIKEELSLDGPMCRRFQALCDRVHPGSNMLERKHQASQVVSIKTRGVATAVQAATPSGELQPVILAKAGVTAPVPKPEQNAYIIDLYLNRVPSQKVKVKSFTPIRDQWTQDVDVVQNVRESNLNYEFDFKRRPVNPRMIEVSGRLHVAFETVPWSNCDEGSKVRGCFDSWRRQRCLKNLLDWSDWDAALKFGLARADAARRNGRRGINMTKDGPVGLMKQTFLRAYAKKEMGAIPVGERLTQTQLAEWLTSIGHPTSKHHVANAGRAVLVEKVVPKCSETEAFAGMLTERFPNLDLSRIWIPD